MIDVPMGGTDGDYGGTAGGVEKGEWKNCEW
jgi:hypothetical protein